MLENVIFVFYPVGTGGDAEIMDDSHDYVRNLVKNVMDMSAEIFSDGWEQDRLEWLLSAQIQ